MKQITIKLALGLGSIVFVLASMSGAGSGQSSSESFASGKAKFLSGPITSVTAQGTIPFLSTSPGSCDTFECAASQGHCSCSRWRGASGTDLKKLGRSKVQTNIKITTNEDDCTVTPDGSCCSIDGVVQFQHKAAIANLIFTGESCAGTIAGSYQMLQGAGGFAAAIGVGDLQGNINSSDGSLGFSIIGIAQFL